MASNLTPNEPPMRTVQGHRRPHIRVKRCETDIHGQRNSSISDHRESLNDPRSHPPIASFQVRFLVRGIQQLTITVDCCKQDT